MTNILDDIKKYREALDEAEKYGTRILETLVNALKQVIPDIRYSIGWEEGGVESLCLWSDTRSIGSEFSKKHNCMNSGSCKFLDLVIEEVFPELKGHIDAPFGLYITREEAQKVREILRKLRGDH